MKKYIKSFVFVASTLVLFNSCGDDFLDRQPTEQISGEALKKAAKYRPAVLEGSIKGLYKAMYTPFIGGTENHTDFGQKGFDIFLDLISQDMALSKNIYSQYLSLEDLSALRSSQNLQNYSIWRYYYKMIDGANTILDTNREANGTYPENTHKVSGQALALRAYSYFMLLHFYVDDINSGKKILPIYKESGIVAKEPSTGREILDFVIQDLEKAVEFLQNFERDKKNEIDANVASVMLTYAYALKGDANSNQKGLQTVESVIAKNQYTILPKAEVAYNEITKKGNGFNSVDSPNWLWGQEISLSDEINLVSWWGQIDWFTFSYAAVGDQKSIDKNLYVQIKDGDVRKNWFSQESESYLMPLNKFYDANRVKFGQRTITSDYVYMRIEEAYLLAAELAAKTGNEDKSKDYLKTLLAQRMDNTRYIDDLHGDELLKEIELQTRIELWGEGKSFFSFKRNKYTVIRGDNHIGGYEGESFEYNSPKLYFEIPSREIENNVNYQH